MQDVEISISHFFPEENINLEWIFMCEIVGLSKWQKKSFLVSYL